HGPHAGQVDTFAVLPGYPDNVRRNSEGEFWVALHAKDTPFAKWTAANQWAAKVLLKFGNFKQLQKSLAQKPHAAAIKLSDEGKIL
ncbi:strictosidine synthase 1-like, partial [Trifolium medium]|nr:strictosidine synthase 1-like [Trifolium medium]